MKKIKKIVLAYSGGLDTSVILKWLQEKYKAEIICYTADLGQNIDRKTIYKNAKKQGVKKIIIEGTKNLNPKQEPKSPLSKNHFYRHVNRPLFGYSIFLVTLFICIYNVSRLSFDNVLFIPTFQI